MFLPIFTLLAALNFRSSVATENFINSVSGEVTHGNFNYYKLDVEGSVLVELISVTGDCDLYVSQHNLKPTYEPQSYCLQSATCGLDSVVIPKSFKRPLGIGVFGHPSNQVSTYHLMIYEVDDSKAIFHYNPYEELSKQDINETTSDLPNQTTKTREHRGYADESEPTSLFWIILTQILEFIISAIL